MKILFYAVIVLLIVSSCNNEANKSSQSSLTETKTFFYNDKGLKSLSFPLTIDTTLIQSLDTNSRITYQQVRELSEHLFMSELVSELIYEFNDFCKIDSLKQAEKFNDYLKKLDIGMTKNSIAYSVGSLKFDDRNTLFIWGITKSSYEACPYFSGTKLIATYVYENKIATTFLIGEMSDFSDPPVLGSERVTSKIFNAKKIDITRVSINQDTDNSNSEALTNSISLAAENGKIILLDSKKDVKTKGKTGYK